MPTVGYDICVQASRPNFPSTSRVYMPIWHSVLIDYCESTSRHFQQEEGPCKGPLRDCENFAKIHFHV